MQFSSIQEIQLALKVKKESETGLFKHQRLLVIKSGYISYYSRIPKEFVGNTRSLELVGQFPKYTLSAEFVISIKYEYPVLQITFLKDKLIDRDNFEKMITSSMQPGKDNQSQKQNSNTNTWHFKCKEIDLAKAFVEQVKICMKPEIQQQSSTVTQDPKQGRKSLQPSFKIVFDAFKQAKQERQSKQIEQIINERASNYFSTSQIQNQQKNRNSQLSFNFLKFRETNAKLQKSKTIVFDKNKFIQQPVLKPIQMPKAYEPGKKDKQNQKTEAKQQSIDLEKQTISKTNDQNTEKVIEKEVSHIWSKKSDRIQENQKQNDQINVDQQLIKTQSKQDEKAINYDQINGFNQKESAQIFKVNSQPDTKEVEKVKQDQQIQQNEFQLQNNHQFDFQVDNKQKSTQILINKQQPEENSPQNNKMQSHLNQHEELKLQNHSDDQQHESKSIGKISSICQDQDIHSNQQHKLTERTESKGSLISLFKVFDLQAIKSQQKMHKQQSQIVQINSQIQLQPLDNNNIPEISPQNHYDNTQQYNHSKQNTEQIKPVKLKIQYNQINQSQNPKINGTQSGKSSRRVSPTFNYFNKNQSKILQQQQKHQQISSKQESFTEKHSQSGKTNTLNAKQINKYTKFIQLHNSKDSDSPTEVNQKQLQQKQNTSDFLLDITKQVSKKSTQRPSYYQILKDNLSQQFQQNIDRQQNCPFSSTTKGANHVKGSHRKSIHQKFQAVKEITVHMDQSQFDQLDFPDGQSQAQRQPLTSNQLEEWKDTTSSKNPNKYKELINKYQQKKIYSKSYKFIMHTDFINYPSLLEQNSQPTIYSSRQNKSFSYHSQTQQDQLSDCTFANYQSRLYFKYQCYKYFSSKLELLNLKKISSDLKQIQQIRVPLVFYLRYKSYEGLFVEKQPLNQQNQGIKEPQINLKTKIKIKKSQLFNKFPQYFQAKSKSILSIKFGLSRQQKEIIRITELKSLRDYLQIFNVFIVQSEQTTQSRTRQFYLLVQEKISKDTVKSPPKTSKQHLNSKQLSQVSTVLENSSVYLKDVKKLDEMIYLNSKFQQVLSPRNIFESIEVLGLIRRLCIQQLSMHLKNSKPSQYIINETDNKIKFHPIQQIFEKVVANKQIHNIYKLSTLNQRQNISNNSSQQMQQQSKEFIESTVSSVLGQLLGFSIGNSNQIMYQAKIESNFSESINSSIHENIHHKQKQTINQFAQHFYLLNEIVENKKSPSIIQLINLFNQLISSNKTNYNLFESLSNFQGEDESQGKGNLALPLTLNWFSQLMQLMAKVESVIQMIVAVNKSYCERRSVNGQDSTQSSIPLHQLSAHSLLLSFYSAGRMFLDSFHNSLVERRQQRIKEAVLSYLNNILAKSTNHINQYISSIQNKQRSISNYIKDSRIDSVSKLKLLARLQLLNQTIMQTYESLFQLQNQSVHGKQHKPKKESLQKTIRNGLSQLECVENFVNNLSLISNSPTKHNSQHRNSIPPNKSKYRLEVIHLQLQFQLGARPISHQTQHKIYQLLLTAINKKDNPYISKSFILFMHLWRQNIVSDSNVVEVFVYLCSIDNLLEDNPFIKEELNNFLTQQITIEHRLFFLKMHPEFQRALSTPKSHTDTQ